MPLDKWSVLTMWLVPLIISPKFKNFRNIVFLVPPPHPYPSLPHAKVCVSDNCYSFVRHNVILNAPINFKFPIDLGENQSKNVHQWSFWTKIAYLFEMVIYAIKRYFQACKMAAGGHFVKQEAYVGLIALCYVLLEACFLDSFLATQIKVAIGSNIAQNHYSTLWKIISGHYLPNSLSWPKGKLGKIRVSSNISQNHKSSV